MASSLIILGTLIPIFIAFSMISFTTFHPIIIIFFSLHFGSTSIGSFRNMFLKTFKKFRTHSGIYSYFFPYTLLLLFYLYVILRSSITLLNLDISIFFRFVSVLASLSFWFNERISLFFCNISAFDKLSSCEIFLSSF